MTTMYPARSRNGRDTQIDQTVAAYTRRAELDLVVNRRNRCCTCSIAPAVG